MLGVPKSAGRLARGGGQGDVENLREKEKKNGGVGGWGWKACLMKTPFCLFSEVQTKKVRKVPPGLPSSVSTARLLLACDRGGFVRLQADREEPGLAAG